MATVADVQRGQIIGYRLSGDDDETTTWLWTTLVQVGTGNVALLCEDCAQVLVAVGIE